MAESASFQIKAQSPADAAVEQLQKKIKEVEAEMRKTARASKESTAAMKEFGDQSSAGADKAKKGFGEIGQALKGAFSLAAIKQFYDYIDERNKKLADDFSKRQLSLLQAISATGDNASVVRSQQIQTFVNDATARNPILTEQQIVAAYGVVRGGLPDMPGQDNLDRALGVAREALPATSTMSDDVRNAVLRSLAMREREQPSASPDELRKRIAETITVMQNLGAGGPAALDRASRAVALQGPGSPDEMFRMGMAAMAAAGTQGDSARIGAEIPAMAQRLFRMSDPETGMRMFPGITSEQQAFQAIASGEIPASTLSRLGIVSPQQESMMTNLQRRFPEYQASIEQASPGILSVQDEVTQRVLGPVLQNLSATRRTEVATRASQRNAAAREAELAAQNALAVETLGPFAAGLLPRFGADISRGLVGDGISNPPMGGATPQPIFGGRTEAEDVRAGAEALRAMRNRGSTNISVNINDGIPAQAEVY
jgi:hypothetical protein